MTRLSFLCALTEWMCGTSTTSHKEIPASFSTDTRKEIPLKELADVLYTQIYRSTENFFSDIAVQVHIQKTNESVREVHVFCYYMITRGILNSRIEEKIKIELMNCITKRYVDDIISYSFRNKTVPENALIREKSYLQSMLQERCRVYDHVDANYFSHKDKMFEGGKILFEMWKDAFESGTTPLIGSSSMVAIFVESMTIASAVTKNLNKISITFN